MKTLFSKIHADLYCGISFFSRLPVQWLYKSDFPFSFGRAIWTWPIISLFLGGIISVFFAIASHLLPSPWTVAFLTLGFQLLLTGGLHEDGLADMADGLGGGKNKEHKLSIMRDSHLGTYGVLILFIMMGIQTSCLVFLVQHHDYAIKILLITAILSRISMLFPFYYSKPARDNGLASTLKNDAHFSIYIAVLFTLILLFLLTSWITAIQYILVSFFLSLGITLLAHRHIDGYTGDILGAIQVFVATGILITSTISISSF